MKKTNSSAHILLAILASVTINSIQAAPTILSNATLFRGDATGNNGVATLALNGGTINASNNPGGGARIEIRQGSEKNQKEPDARRHACPRRHP